MPVNPSNTQSPLSSPVERANKLNDPQFQNQQGYFGYDLTHDEVISPRFGEITPSMNLSTVPADRHIVHDNCKTVINQINGNLLSQVNQYVDSFYIPLRACYPTNYEKLIPLPTKGDDLPNSALPVVPLFQYLRELYYSETAGIEITEGDDRYSMYDIFTEYVSGNSTLNSYNAYYFGRLAFVAYILSRGQLLDYLGFCLDTNSNSREFTSELQHLIDVYFGEYISLLMSDLVSDAYGVRYNLTSDTLHLDDITNIIDRSTLSSVRQGISDTFEKGSFIYFDLVNSSSRPELFKAATDLVYALERVLVNEQGEVSVYSPEEFDTLDLSVTSVRMESVNITKVLAYQLAVAQYFTNEHVDNIFTADLYMQNLRASMFPTTGRFTQEPIFTFNGVQTEFDYLSYGGFYTALIEDRPGIVGRQQVVGSLLFILRRSLRYGDKFATARPRPLAVGQLEIYVENGSISPVDVTRNLLMQRYLNAGNYIGSGLLQYFASMYGVTPSDTGCIPRFLAHRKIPLENRLTNNTSDNQGYQTTNLVGYSDNNAFDVFIDDFGIIISVVSYDVLPVYTSGIDEDFFFSDRYDYFNPMLQNVGDEPLMMSEILGNRNNLIRAFGYSMRNSAYKYKASRSHGAFVNDLPGWLMRYPTADFVDDNNVANLRISPEFIRDKPMYFDQLVPQLTGYSPAQYYHFGVKCTNQVHSARKMQATPPVLF